MGFRIDRVAATSKTKGVATIEFGEGLTIIQGPSNTGKTCIAKCIDFVFGKNGDRNEESTPFSDVDGYDTVTMTIRPNDASGYLILSREIKQNKVRVTSTVSGIPSGVYDTKGRDGSKYPPLNDIWLMLLGIPPETKVASSSFKPERLTWRDMLHFFYLTEDNVVAPNSVMRPRDHFRDSKLSLSALLYLIDEQNHAHDDIKESRNVRKAKHDAKKELLTWQIAELEKRRKRLRVQLNEHEDSDMEALISQATDELSQTRNRIEQAITDSQGILAQINDIQEQIAECNVLLNRFDKLSKQYQSNLRRLSLVIAGEKGYSDTPAPLICPYCDNPLPARKHESYKESARAEIKHIQAQLTGLKKTVSDIRNSRDVLQSELDRLKGQRDNLAARVEELRPQEAEQGRMLEMYKEYLHISSRFDVISECARVCDDTIQEIDEEQSQDDANIYNPIQYFAGSFAQAMSDYAQQILTACNYAPPFVKSWFDYEKLDIAIDGRDKARSYGKGYHSYLNTIVMLMLRQYLAANAKHYPGLLIIDTPILGFDEGRDPAMPDSMKRGLFQYFLDHQGIGQIIIIENTEHVPDIDYEAYGAKVITFTKASVSGARRGFLNGVE